MMPTPKQIVENIDKILEEKRERNVIKDFKNYMKGE